MFKIPERIKIGLTEFCAIVAHTRRIAELLKEQLDSQKEKS